MELKDLNSVTIEANNKLQLYNARQQRLVQVVFTDESALKWQDFISTTIEVMYNFKPNRQ